MFQFDAGDYDDTLAREGTRILTISGNTDAAVDFVIDMVIRSTFITSVSNSTEAIDWMNGVRVDNSRLEPWAQTVTRYYNGCPMTSSCWAERLPRYRSNAVNVYYEMGAAFWDVTGTPPPPPPPPPPGDGASWVVLEEKSCSGTCDFGQIKADLNAVGKDIGFVKIGFHVGPTGNQNGLGDWERTLHDAGVPFFLKSVDSAGQIFEAVQLKAASGCIDNSRGGGASGCVPHELVYRRSVTGSPGEWRPDVPYSGSPDCANPPPADTPYQNIYNEMPYDAAVEHWSRQRAEFPPELEQYKHLIWIETINEINRGGTCDFGAGGGETFPHNVGLVDPVFGQYTKESEWIAEFAIHTANIAMAEGFNWAAFGWSSGEPEIGSWAGPKMREFLELAAANPNRIALATHEYSYTTDGLELAFPYQLGRFQEVFDVADHFGFARPTIVITEFGWSLNDIPSVDQSMNVDLSWAAKLYAPHHEIRGAAIWYLGGGWGGIDNETQQLIAPIAEYGKSHYFVLGPP